MKMLRELTHYISDKRLHLNIATKKLVRIFDKYLKIKCLIYVIQFFRFKIFIWYPGVRMSVTNLILLIIRTTILISRYDNY